MILLPDHTPEAMRPFVIAHEKSHIARLDHVFKPLFYLAACIYWFHPLVWVAFFLFAQDMEMACDEKTIRSFSPEEKKDYSFSLLALSLIHISFPRMLWALSWKKWAPARRK